MYQLMKKSLVKASRDDDVEEAVKVSFSQVHCYIINSAIIRINAF